jgi:DNA-binding Lrp family transcriptional regulator
VTSAFILINTEVGSEVKVYHLLNEIPEVKKVDKVYGVYDIIALIEANTMQRLRELLSHKIRRIPEIRSTTTMIVI